MMTLSCTKPSGGPRGLRAVSRSLFLTLCLILGFASPLSATNVPNLYIHTETTWDPAALSTDNQMELVKQSDSELVYNWTGKLPASFVLTSSDGELVLGAETTLDISNSNIVSLIETEVSTSETFLTPVNKTDKNGDDLLIVESVGGQWMAKVVKPLCINDTDLVDEFININSPMICKFEGDVNIYNWEGDLNIDFRIGKSNSGVEYNRAILVGTSSPSAITVGNTYQLDNNGKSLFSYEILRNVHLQIIVDPSATVATMIVSEASAVSKEPAYALVGAEGEIKMMEESDGVWSVTAVPDSGGFLIGEYPEGTVPSGLSDFSALYSNRGGVTYFYDELLSSLDSTVPASGDYMTVAEDNENNLSFKFNAKSKTLRVSGEHECIHVPIYFYNDPDASPFTAPHIRVVNAEGRLFTAADGSAMSQPEVELFGANDSFWRFDLWIPESETVAHQAKKGLRKAASPYQDTTPITPSTTVADNSSNLQFTFTDGKSSASDSQFSNVPLIPGGVYALKETENPLPSHTNHIYLIESESNQMLSTLDQDPNGTYLFKGRIDNSQASGTLGFYIATFMNSDETPGGTFYGAAEDITASVISRDLSSESTSYNFNGTMVEGSTNPWELDYFNITPPAGVDNKGVMAVSVEIGPEKTYGISFGFKDGDFQTSVLTPAVSEVPVRWFTLQGEPLFVPRPGFLIRVDAFGAHKVLLP